MSKLTLEVVEVDGRMVVDGPTVTMDGAIGAEGELTFADEQPGEPVVDDEPPATNGDLEELIESAVESKLPESIRRLLSTLPDMAEDEVVDPRDRFLGLSNEKLTSPRFRNIPGVPSLPGGVSDAPGQAPVVNTSAGTRGTVNIYDMGAREGDRNACRAAMTKALRSIKDGGKIFVPYGRWPMHDVECPAHKDYEVCGETELGAELVGAPERDILFFDDPGAQQRLNNRQIFRHLRFFMPGNGKRGSFNRKTELGFQAGAGAIAWRMPSGEGDQRKGSWAASYLTLQDLTFHGEKDALGACAFVSERPLYGMRAKNIFIGNHGANISGLHGGLVWTRPRVQLTEATSDKFVVDTLVHWGGVCSIAIYNVANGSINDHEVYAAEMALHLAGYDDKSGNRSRCRQIELSGCYYDNDVRPIGRNSPPMVHVNSDTTILQSMHIKGAKNGDHSPVVEIKGRNFRGGVIDIMSSARHKSPIFRIEGDGHDFAIEPAGVPDAHRDRMINGGKSYRGVAII